jgi:hypothetical protein
MKKIIFLLAITIASYGCKKENPVTNSSRLIGEWSWLSTCAGNTDCLTPGTTHNSINVVFTVDSVYNYYLNDTLRLSHRFRTFQSISESSKDTLYFINFESAGVERYLITHDTLSLFNDDPNILISNSSRYKRIK